MSRSVDANVIIGMWQIHYPHDLLPEVWAALDDAGRQREVFLCEQVRNELRDDSFREWLADKPYLVRATGEAELRIMRTQILADTAWRQLVSPDSEREEADPYVIAHAIAVGGVVVTDEGRRSNSRQRPKIPDVCDGLGIGYIRTPEFVRYLLEFRREAR